MRNSSKSSVSPHLEIPCRQCLSAYEEFLQMKCISSFGDSCRQCISAYEKFLQMKCISSFGDSLNTVKIRIRGNTHFHRLENTHIMVNLRMGKHTGKRVFPHTTELHLFGCTSDTWTFTRKGEFPHVFYSWGYVYFRGEDMRKYTGLCESPPRGNTRGNVNLLMGRYTRKCVIPLAVIH